MSEGNGWTPYKLDQLGTVSRGRSRHRPRNEPSLYGGPYPFFQTGDIKAAELYLRNFEQTYSEKGLAQSKLWEPGTVCITIAANIAETAILSLKGCFPDSVVGFVAEQNQSDPCFIKYYIDTIKLSMQNVSQGTTQDNLSVEKLLSFDFLVPDVALQRKIASILSAYDDLIENNTRRIAILEEMAQAIYREWFVNFRFPGHENVKLVDSPLGQIPECWEAVTTRDAIDIKPRTHVPKDGEKPFVSMGAVPHNTMLIDESLIESRTKNSGSKFKNGDTLFARITPCLENGKTAFVSFLPSDDDVACGSTEFIVLRSKSVIPEFVYLLARSDEFRDIAIKSMSGATGRQRVREECFDQFYFAHPTPTLLEQFRKVANPLFRSVFTLAKKNRNLRTTRDLLLPKLISGKLDVEDLDIDVGMSAEALEEAKA